jgi:DNA polymerase zeta
MDLDMAGFGYTHIGKATLRARYSAAVELDMDCWAEDVVRTEDQVQGNPCVNIPSLAEIWREEGKREGLALDELAKGTGADVCIGQGCLPAARRPDALRWQGGDGEGSVQEIEERHKRNPLSQPSAQQAAAFLHMCHRTAPSDEHAHQDRLIQAEEREDLSGGHVQVLEMHLTQETSFDSAPPSECSENDFGKWLEDSIVEELPGGGESSASAAEFRPNELVYTQPVPKAGGSLSPMMSISDDALEATYTGYLRIPENGAKPPDPECVNAPVHPSGEMGASAGQFPYCSRFLTRVGESDIPPTRWSGWLVPLFGMPPNRLSVECWSGDARHKRAPASQISSVTQASSLPTPTPRRGGGGDNYSVLSMELLPAPGGAGGVEALGFCFRQYNTSGQLHSEDVHEEVGAIFVNPGTSSESEFTWWCESCGARQNCALCVCGHTFQPRSWRVAAEAELPGQALPAAPVNMHFRVVHTEADLLLAFVAQVRSLNPDFCVGWEAEMASFGFLFERSLALRPGPRGKAEDALLLRRYLSRAPSEEIFCPSHPDKRVEDYIRHQGVTALKGRSVLSLWRFIKDDAKAFTDSREAAAAAVLRRRLPVFAPNDLRSWLHSSLSCHKALSHLVDQASVNLDLAYAVDLMGKNGTMARLLGVPFDDVLTRGSQYRVEALLSRVLEKRGFAAPSPSRLSVDKMAAPSEIPMVMEPQSSFYHDPVVVLDFRSLYPSQMIAYNLCYSTIMGKLDDGPAATSGKLGTFPFTERKTAEAAEHHSRRSGARPLVTPNGAIIAQPEVREGVLPAIVRELLATRVMVKKAKARALAGGHEVLARSLEARQLALKLVANVTYGYVGASMSGRMPMAELADAIVSCSRRTLDSAISLINKDQHWAQGRATVVYGDTDSLFVLLPGCSMEQAFAAGKEMVQVISASSEPPIELKLEKVYAGSFLVTKKRYAGYAYEGGPSTDPFMDIKGLEAIRKDQCRLVAKCQYKAMRELCISRDLRKVENYCQRVFTKIRAGEAGIRDFVFSHQVREQYRGSGPLAAQLGGKLPHKFRCSFVIVDLPGKILRERVKPPDELLRPDTAYRIDSKYYLEKALLPKLSGVLSLAGANVESWLKYCPHPPSRISQLAPGQMGRYFKSDRCFLCGRRCGALAACEDCGGRKGGWLVAMCRLRDAQRAAQLLSTVCARCTGSSVTGRATCHSLDCPVYYQRFSSNSHQAAAAALLDELGGEREGVEEHKENMY